MSIDREHFASSLATPRGSLTANLTEADRWKRGQRASSAKPAFSVVLKTLIEKGNIQAPASHLVETAISLAFKTLKRRGEIMLATKKASQDLALILLGETREHPPEHAVQEYLAREIRASKSLTDVPVSQRKTFRAEHLLPIALEAVRAFQENFVTMIAKGKPRDRRTPRQLVIHASLPGSTRRDCFLICDTTSRRNGLRVKEIQVEKGYRNRRNTRVSKHKSYRNDPRYRHQR